MVKINELFDLKLLDEMVEQGYVTLRYHNDNPNLVIANYTALAQYSWKWNEVTEQCRGLIWDVRTHEVVARPFPKFHNYDQSGVAYPPSGPVIRMEKMDGSLGILYSFDVEGHPDLSPVWAVATRGSFHSEQAEFATDFYQKHQFVQGTLPALGHKGNLFKPLAGKTYLFEIIFPANRIVVDYGEYEGLVLIDVIDIETGFSDTDEFDNCAWPEKVTRTPLPGFDSGQMADIPAGEEGFVYLWPTRNLRVKLKSAEYIMLHRLISNLNEKTIWEHLVAGGTLDSLKRDLPEEFHGFIDDKGKAMLKAASAIMSEAYRVYDEVKGLSTRKDQALALAKSEYKGLVFKLLDGKTIWRDCLVQVKPKKTPTEEE